MHHGVPKYHPCTILTDSDTGTCAFQYPIPNCKRKLPLFKWIDSRKLKHGKVMVMIISIGFWQMVSSQAATQLNKFGWEQLSLKSFPKSFLWKLLLVISQRNMLLAISQSFEETSTLLQTQSCTQPSLENLPIHVMKMVKMCNGFCYRNGEST